MKNIAKLLDFKKLGLEVSNSSTIVPLKSCAGIYFYVNEEYKKLSSSCKSCLGSQVNCSLCQETRVNGNV